MQALAHQNEAELRRALTRGRVTVLVHEDMDMPEWFSSMSRGVVRV